MTKKITKLAFFDFDGVLHPQDAGDMLIEDGHLVIVGDNLFANLPRVRAWLDENAEVGVVVSSSWRNHYTEDELRERLGIGARLVGITPRGHANRGEEILAFLATRPSVTHWCAFDDEPTLYPTDFANLILCAPMIGVTSIELAQADEILNWRPAPRTSFP